MFEQVSVDTVEFVDPSERLEMTYDEWMVDNVPHKYGTCVEVTLAMAKEFPELTRVRGHYYCSSWGERAHWWSRVWLFSMR